MKSSYRLIVFAVCLLIFSCAKQTSELDKKYSIKELMDNELLYGLSLSHDEKSIIYSVNISGIFNIYLVNNSTGNIEMLTNSKDDSYFVLSYIPNDKSILFSSDKGL